MSSIDNPQPVVIQWDWGTAYDLFFSLLVLHRPDEFGLRRAWAAGVRSRLSPEDRKMLEEAQEVVRFPLYWIYSQPPPKDGAGVLSALRDLPAEERLPALALCDEGFRDAASTLKEVAERRAWTEQDLTALKRSFAGVHKPPERLDLKTALDWWARPDEFGERYLQALHAYYESFFAEEEQRIRPYLEDAIARARDLSTQMEWPALLEELSQGVLFTSLAETSELVLAPSFWSTPLILYERLGDGRLLVLFGGRPADISLVPGDVIPDAMLRALKAVAEPTRLRILRYLSGEALTPSQLSRKLRLRAPTVVHHLKALRLAGLVRLIVSGDGEKRYTIRKETIGGAFNALRKFLEIDEEG